MQACEAFLQRTLTPRRLLLIFTTINMLNYLDRGIIPVRHHHARCGGLSCGLLAFPVFLRLPGLRSRRLCARVVPGLHRDTMLWCRVHSTKWATSLLTRFTPTAPTWCLAACKVRVFACHGPGCWNTAYPVL